MRIALFGDIHANLEALEAVLEDAGKQEVTDYVCMGDIVGYNADPVACLEKVREMVRKKVKERVRGKVRRIKFQKNVPLSFGEVRVRQNETTY